MKKFLIGTLATIFAVAIVFAAGSKAPEKSPAQTSFYWFNTSGAYDGFRSTADEMTLSGCQDLTQTVCRNGYVESDLIDPAHPELGVKSGATPDDVITRTN